MLRTSSALSALTLAPTGSGWPQWLTRHLTGEYLRIVHGMQFGTAALANAASNGTGPPFTKQGGKLVSYWRDDVDEWARTRMSRKVRSTSELREPDTKGALEREGPDNDPPRSG
jgi:hypothetical protein